LLLCAVCALEIVAIELFGLVYPDETASYFMLKIDRGTMPVVRRGKDRTRFARKIELYLDIWKGKVHTAQFGFQAMRVLTVTPSRTRVETMVEATHDLTNGKGSGLFLLSIARRSARATRLMLSG
jgi:hypothetical protein